MWGASASVCACNEPAPERTSPAHVRRSEWFRQEHDKIISRYYRSLELLPEAVTYSNRTYIFDNSGHERVWVAEVTDGEVLEMKTAQMPYWFKTALWDKFEIEGEEGKT